MTKEENVREDKNKKECLAWIEKSTMPDAEKEWCRQVVEKGDVFVAYNTLCTYQEGEGPYSSGTFSLWGAIIEW